MRYALAAVRIVLGAIFVYAAWTKLREPWVLFAMSVDAYALLPHWAVLVVARTLPWAELLLGLVLLTGFWQRAATLAASALLLLFFSMLVRSYAHGLAIDCACFGFGEAISPRTLVRDGVLLAGSIALTVLVFRARRATMEHASRDGASYPCSVGTD